MANIEEPRDLITVALHFGAVIDLYVEAMLFLSVIPAFVALGFVDERISRFGLSFYILFSSLAIFAMGEPISAILYLVGFGVVVTIMIAYLEGKWKTVSHGYVDTRFKTKLALIIIVLTAAFLVSRQLAYAVSLSIVSIGLLSIDRKNPLRSIVGLVVVEAAIFVILAELGLFAASIALLLSLLAIAGNLIFACLFLSAENVLLRNSRDVNKERVIGGSSYDTEPE